MGNFNNKEYQAKYREANREKLRLWAKEYRDQNPEKKKESAKKYFQKNKHVAYAHINQTKEQIDELLLYLSNFYTIHNQVWESRHGAGYNYWDVLMIKK